MSFLTRAILVAALTVLVSGEPAAAAWVTEVVRSTGDVGSWSSIAVFSPANNLSTELHISYYDATSRNLQYVKKIGRQGWTRQTVASRGDVGASNALAVGKLRPNVGQPRIAYNDVTRGTVSYANHSAAEGWQIDPLRDMWYAAGGYSPSLVIDSQDRYHIVHEKRVLRPNMVEITVLQYLTPTRQSVYGHDLEFLSGHIIGSTSSLAVAPDDTLHVAFLDECSRADCEFFDALWLVYGSNTGVNGAWEMEWVTPVPNEFTRSSIAVDAQGAVHIVYDDRINGLKHLTNASGQWTEQVVYDSTFVIGSSMQLDSGGHLHISYVARGGNRTTLRYATNKSGAWVNEAVDGTRRIGAVTSIAIDRFGEPHISYYDATSRNLRHAVRTRDVISPNR